MGIRSSKDKKISSTVNVEDGKLLSSTIDEQKITDLIEYKSPYRMIESIPDMVNVNIKHLIMSFLYKKAKNVIDMNTPQYLNNWLYVFRERKFIYEIPVRYSGQRIILRYKYLSQINDPFRDIKLIKLKITGTIRKYLFKERMHYYLYIDSDIICDNLVKLDKEMLRINTQHQFFFRKDGKMKWISVNDAEIVPEDMYNKECTYILLVQHPINNRLRLKIIECIKEELK